MKPKQFQEGTYRDKPYNKKKVGSQSNITPQWTRKEKEQTKPKVRRRKEIFKNREEIKIKNQWKRSMQLR